MAITQTIHLTQHQREPFPIIDAVQNDTGRSVKMIIDDVTLASGNTGELYFKRPDNSYYNVSATLSTSDNSFTADLTQGLTKPGTTECQLRVTASSKAVSTFTFLVRVQPAVDGVPSVSQLGYTIDDIIDAANHVDQVASQFVIDDTLSIQGAAADAKATGDGLDLIDHTLEKYVGVKSLAYTSGGYIDCSGSTVNVNSVTSSSSYAYLLDSCSPGDKYIVNGTAASAAKGWCFVKSDGTRLAHQADNNVTTDMLLCIAPAESAYFVSNYRNTSTDPFCLKMTDSVMEREGFVPTSYEYTAPIRSGADFNDYTAPGSFYVSSIAVAETISNIPTSKAGRLTVYTLASASSYKQTYDTTDGFHFERAYTSGAWSSWGYDIKSNNRTHNLNLNYSDAAQISANSDLDSYTTPGNFLVATTAIAKTIDNIPELTSGRLTVLTLAGSGSAHQWFIASSNNWYARELISGTWSRWKHLIDEGYINEINVTASKAAYNALQAVIKNVPYDLAYANAYSPLKLSNYLGNIQNVHPKVLYFSSGFGGHTYWMAYTPYPYSKDGYENPCIAYSDDGYNWTNIEGNPLDNPQGNGYDSDTHLVYRSDTQTLECWYRYVGPESQSPREETIYRQTTTDGVTWSAKEVVYSNTTGSYAKFLSPAVIVENNKYCIWVVEDTGAVDYYEAPTSNVTNWTLIRSLSFTISDGGTTVKPWHIDVIKTGSTYAMLIMARNSTSVSTAKCSLFIVTSLDNVTYSNPVKVIGGAENWDRYMYRSSIVKVGSRYRIYYSAGSGGTTTIYNNATWGIGITESDSLTSGYIGLYE